jgi:Integrase core domain
MLGCPFHLLVPSTYCVCLVNIERSAGLVDDGRHDHRGPHRPPPWCPDPALPRAREPRVAAPTGHPPTHRAASAAANRRPPVLGPAVPPVGRLDGCHLRRPTRHRDPVAAYRLPALLGLEEPPERAGPSGCRAGGPSAHPTDVQGQPPLGRAADSRGTPETGGRDLASDGIQVSCAPSEAAIADLEDLLDNHLGSLVAVDFFVVPTAMFKVLFVFVILAHGRRRVVHINVTDTPTAQWTAKQLVEAFPWDTAPRYLLRDRDGVYGVEFSSRVKGMGIGEVMTAPRWPWQNPYVERLIGTLRRECLETSWC